jgi:hypothetical protein
VTCILDIIDFWCNQKLQQLPKIANLQAIKCITQMSVKLFKNRYAVQVMVRYVLKLESTSLTFTLMESEILLFRRERKAEIIMVETKGIQFLRKSVKLLKI